jgi:serine/threonine-protein kinase
MPLPLPQESSVRLAVLGELAAGGMGRIDLARVVGAEEWVVAVKRLHPHLARDAHFASMFLDEVRVAGLLRHPNIVEIVGWGRDDEGIFLAMEFVSGAPLSHVAFTGRMAGAPLPEHLVAFVGARIADALAVAHDLCGADGQPLGIIHRDVTPSNVLLGFDGTVKLTDFGVAKAAGRATQTATGVLKGKVGYMSPEYAKGRAFDRRSDVYSEGVVLYELCCGARPFHAEHDWELLRLIAEAAPPPLPEVAPGTSPELARLVHGMLEKDPARRPQDAGTVRRALDAWLAARGASRARLEAELGAYVLRFGGDRPRDIAALLALPGEEVRRRDAGRTHTLTELYAVGERAATLRKAAPVRRRDTGPQTREVAARPSAQVLEGWPQALASPPALADGGYQQAGPSAQPALPSSPSEDVEDATQVYDPTAAPRGGHGDDHDETLTVPIPPGHPLRSAATGAAAKAGGTRRSSAQHRRPLPPGEARASVSRAKLIAAALASFVIVALIMSAALVAATSGRDDRGNGASGSPPAAGH